MAGKLTDEEIVDYKEVFSLFDKDGDGSISADELGAAMRSLGQSPTDEVLKGMVQEVDLDKNGRIELSEFLDFMLKLKRLKGAKEVDSKEDLREAFRMFDQNSDGLIATDELIGIIGNLGVEFDPGELEALIGTADSDCDGQITCEEFVTMMTSK